MKDLIRNQIDYSPKISIIIPVYNVEDYLCKCLDSVLQQTLREIEVICINDGSQDASLRILKEYAYKDKRITVISRENKGVGYSRNQAIKCSKGEFIAFIDPDDYYPSPDILHTMYNHAIEHNVSICGGSLIVYSETKEIQRRNACNYFPQNCLISYDDFQYDYGFQRFIYNRKLIIEGNIQFPEYRFFEDPPFMVRAFTAAGNFYGISDYVYAYRKSHKERCWSEESVYHLLCGIKDNLELASHIGLNVLYTRTLLHIQKDFNNVLARISSERIEQTKKDIMQICLRFAQKEFEGKDSSTNLSVLLPIYNAERLLGLCLDRLLSECSPETEIICINDGSTDNSLAIIDEYRQKDKRIKCINKPQAGYGQSVNCGLVLATGDYIAVVNPDDNIKLSAFEILYNKAKKYNLDVAKSDFLAINKVYTLNKESISNKTERKEASYYLKHISPCNFHNSYRPIAIFKKSFLSKKGIWYNESSEIPYADDNFLKCALNQANKVLLWDNPLHCFCQINSNDIDDKLRLQPTVQEGLEDMESKIKSSLEQLSGSVESIVKNNLDALEKQLSRSYNEIIESKLNLYSKKLTDNFSNQILNQTKYIKDNHDVTYQNELAYLQMIKQSILITGEDIAKKHEKQLLYTVNNLLKEQSLLRKELIDSQDFSRKIYESHFYFHYKLLFMWYRFRYFMTFGNLKRNYQRKAELIKKRINEIAHFINSNK